MNLIEAHAQAFGEGAEKVVYFNRQMTIFTQIVQQTQFFSNGCPLGNQVVQWNIFRFRAEQDIPNLALSGHGQKRLIRFAPIRRTNTLAGDYFNLRFLLS